MSCGVVQVQSAFNAIIAAISQALDGEPDWQTKNTLRQVYHLVVSERARLAGCPAESTNVISLGRRDVIPGPGPQ